MGIGLWPFCGIVLIYQGMAERYTYLASAGLALLVVVIGVESQARFRPFVLGLIAVWVLWGVYRLETRITDWSDAARLYGHSLQATPRSAKLHYNLGAVLEERRDFAQASTEYSKAVGLEPYYEPALAGLGNVDLNLGRAKEASQMFEKALQLKPDDVKAVTNYGTALQLLGETDARTVLGLRADRARHKPATAIRTNVKQHPLDAIGAERALIAADARLRRGRRQRLVAVLARRTQLEHRAPYSAMTTPEPPISFGRSFILGSPSFIRSLVS